MPKVSASLDVSVEPPQVPTTFEVSDMVANGPGSVHLGSQFGARRCMCLPGTWSERGLLWSEWDHEARAMRSISDAGGDHPV